VCIFYGTAESLRRLLQQHTAHVRIFEKFDSPLTHLVIGQQLQGKGLLVCTWIFEKFHGSLTNLVVSY
jgi:hypothetical protein